jgi:hypothetical protein
MTINKMQSFMLFKRQTQPTDTFRQFNCPMNSLMNPLTLVVVRQPNTAFQ